MVCCFRLVSAIHRVATGDSIGYLCAWDSMSCYKKIPDKRLNLSSSFKTEFATLHSFVLAKELIEQNELEVGDIVEIDRIIYSHWALYVGDGQVVHVTGSESDIATTTNARVGRCLLGEVARDSCVRVNNKTVGAKERGVSPLPGDVIVKNVLRCVGNTVDYNFLTRNSEHYVTEWRYDLSWSDEADTASHAMTAFSCSPVHDFPEAAHRTMMSGITTILHSPTHTFFPTTPSYWNNLPSNKQTDQECKVITPLECKQKTERQPSKVFQNNLAETRYDSTPTDLRMRTSRELSPREEIAIEKLKRHTGIDVQAD